MNSGFLVYDVMSVRDHRRFEGTAFFRNVGKHSSNDAASYYRRPDSVNMKFL